MKSKILTLLLLAIGLNVLSQSVPNTTTFSLQDVVSATGGSSLSAAFSNAVSGYFDPAYNNDTYAPSGSMLRFRNYNMSPTYIGFESTGVPVSIDASGNVRRGGGGGGSFTLNCYAYDVNSKIGYHAGMDGRLRMYDFSNPEMPEINFIEFTIGVALTFVKIVAGGALFVADGDYNLYMSPSVSDPVFHTVTRYNPNGNIYDMSNNLIAVSGDGVIYKYIADDPYTPGWDDHLEYVVSSVNNYGSVASNNSYTFAFDVGVDYQKRASNSNLDTWANTGGLFSNNSGVYRAVDDGVNIYIVHPETDSYTHYIPAGYPYAANLLFVGHSTPAFSVSGSGSSVAFLYNGSFEITSNSGSSWTRVNYSNTYPIYYISTY